MLTAHEIIDMFGLRNATIQRDEITCSCPYSHNHKRGDRRPSFGISVDKQVFYCFGCQESGNLIKLAQDVLGMTYMEAADAIYRDMTTEEVLALMNGGISEAEKKPEITPLEADIERWCDGPKDYWYSRGFNDDTIGKWRLGCDTLEQRATVPIYFKGKLAGWTKRALSDSQQPKWSHYPGMQKSKLLFGMDRAKSDSAILVEAPLSAIMLDQYGIENAVASFGAGLSDEQAILLRSHYNNVLIFYDPDEAGWKGTAKAIKKLSPFLGTYIVQPTRDDPAAMTKEECLEAIYGKSVIPAWAWR